MEYELTSQKLDDRTSLVKNKHTNEPVAFLTKPKNAFPKTAVQAQWHPSFKLLYPEVHDNLLTRNFGKDFDSTSAAVDALNSKSRPYIFDSGATKDPVKTVYKGTEPGKDSYDRDIAIHKWHIHDDEGNPIGSIKSAHGPDTIHAESPVRLSIGSDIASSVPDSVKEAAGKKYPSATLSHAMHRFRYMLDNKGKEPRFIGTQASDRGNTNIFKTKLNPEDASKAYEDHLRSKLGAEHGSGYTFTRHSPTVFSAIKPADSVYGTSGHHHVISMPGEIHHIQSQISHPDYESGRKNTQIIESYVQDPNAIYAKQSLEEHLVASVIGINTGMVSSKNIKQIIKHRLG